MESMGYEVVEVSLGTHIFEAWSKLSQRIEQRGDAPILTDYTSRVTLTGVSDALRCDLSQEVTESRSPATGD